MAWLVVFLGCVFSTDQGIDEIGAVQHRFLRRAPENRPRVPGLVEALAVNRSYGGGTITDFSKHPPKKNINGVNYSAAGEYQIIEKTYNSVGQEIGLTDFHRHTQDLVATQILIDKGAVLLIRRGDILGAIARVARTWSSLPGGPQPRLTGNQFLSDYNAALKGK